MEVFLHKIRDRAHCDYAVCISEKVILFLTGGKPDDATSPTDSSEPGYSYYGGDILQDIRERNARLNNSVIILTYGIGDGQL